MAAARVRASLTDDDSASDHLTLEMVRMNPSGTAAPLTPPNHRNLIEPDEQTMLEDSMGATNAYDLLSQNNITLIDGIQREYEIPNVFTFKKIENLLERMQDEKNGLPIKSVKSFMSKIPSVFTGQDLIQWILKTLDVDDTVEALHLANLISSNGYILPIEDHVLTVKNDGTFYRFQTPYFWPSNHGEPDNIDYAVYLCKRTMQNKTRLELADYEAENLARLQKLFARKWELIYLQAEAQIKVDKKRDKVERNVLDSQERAFWDVHRPAPGCVNITEHDIKKLMRRKSTIFPPRRQTHGHRKSSNSSVANAAAPASALAYAANRNLITMTVGLLSTNPNQPSPCRTPVLRECDETALIDQLCHEIEFLKHRIDRRCLKTSKVCESFLSYFEQYAEFDPFFTPCEPSNPWLTDSTDLWELEKMVTAKEISSRRVKRWGFSINELLKDPIGRDYFWKFLDKEYSSENLRFYEACIQLRFHTPEKDVHKRVHEIYNEFLSPGAYYSINIDQRVMNITKNNMTHSPSRYTFDEAQDHIFNLMNRDTYARFLRSETYKELLLGGKKKLGLKSGRMSIVLRNQIDTGTTSHLASNEKYLLGIGSR